MGKGDRKTRRGKIWRKTFGVRRPRKGESAHPEPKQSKPSGKKKSGKK